MAKDSLRVVVAQLHTHNTVFFDVLVNKVKDLISLGGNASIIFVTCRNFYYHHQREFDFFLSSTANSKLEVRICFVDRDYSISFVKGATLDDKYSNNWKEFLGIQEIRHSKTLKHEKEKHISFITLHSSSNHQALVNNGTFTSYMDYLALSGNYKPILNFSSYVLNKNYSTQLAKKASKNVLFLSAPCSNGVKSYIGGSFLVNTAGNVINQLASWENDYMDITYSGSHVKVNSVIDKKTCGREYTANYVWQDIYQVIINGLRSYFLQSGLYNVIVGVSGGVDSALVATIAVDALSAQNVLLFFLPSEYTSDVSYKLSKQLADNLNVKHKLLPINDILRTTIDAIRYHGMPVKEVTMDNIQARIRMLLLMSYANNGNGLLLNSGNKSEILTGYFTLYGDGAGGYAPIKNVYKTDVYNLAKWRNTHVPNNVELPVVAPIPDSVINRSPTAELRLQQQDSDCLPNYHTLDIVLKGLNLRHCRDDFLCDNEEFIIYKQKIQRFLDDNIDVVKNTEQLIRDNLFKKQLQIPGPEL